MCSAISYCSPSSGDLLDSLYSREVRSREEDGNAARFLSRDIIRLVNERIVVIVVIIGADLPLQICYVTDNFQCRLDSIILCFKPDRHLCSKLIHSTHDPNLCGSFIQIFLVDAHCVSSPETNNKHIRANHF